MTPPFAYLPPTVVAAWPKLSPSAKDVAVALASCMDGKGECFMLRETICERSGLKKKDSVTNGTKELNAAGLLEIKRRQRASSVFRWKVFETPQNGPSKNLETPQNGSYETPSNGSPTILTLTKENSTYDFSVKTILKEYGEKVKPPCLDGSRARAKRHLLGLLKKYPTEKLLAAVRNYAREQEAAGTERQYRRGSGNFFGRDADWQEYAADDWTPPPPAQEASGPRYKDLSKEPVFRKGVKRG